MKYFGIALILALIPLTAALLSSGPSGRRQVAFLFGAIPFFAPAIHIIFAPISWAYWPGYSKGMEISLIDGIAVGILVALPQMRGRANYSLPFFLLMGLAVISAFGATAPMATMFVAWQIFRVWLIFVAATRLAADPSIIRAMLGGMILGLGSNALAGAVQHLQGVHQAPGLFPHQNMIGLISHYVSIPAAALYVADRNARWALLGIAAAAAVAIAGASRATVGLETAGLALLIVMTIMFWPNQRAYALLAVGVAGLVLAAPLAYKALKPRIADAEASSYDEREAFQNVALAMVHDHPLGVGANHYVIVANVQGYSDRFHVAPVQGSRSANVHNAYLLSAAEMGWAGTAAFVWLTVLTALHGVYWAFRSPDKRLAIMLFGFSMAQVVVALHNLFEWISVTYVVQVVFCLNLGIVAALVGQVRRARAEARGAPVAADDGRPGAGPRRNVPAPRQFRGAVPQPGTIEGSA